MGRRVEEEVGWGGCGVGGAARRQIRCGGKVGKEGRGGGGGEVWGRRGGISISTIACVTRNVQQWIMKVHQCQLSFILITNSPCL